MNLNAAKIIRPRYYRDFRCSPEECLETCCGRWQIQIDRATYERYHNSKDETIRRIAKRYIKENDDSISKHDHAFIQLDPMGRCPFLNEESYCNVQLTLGEEALSETCKTYPRVIYRTGEKIMVGLETTCSVAAKSLLFESASMEVDLESPGEPMQGMLSDTHHANETSPETIWIQQQVLHLLRDRRFSIDERLHHTGAYLIRVLAGHHPDDLIEEQGYHMINPRTFTHLNHLLSLKFPAGDRVGFFSKRYPGLLNEMLDGFERMKSGQEEEIYRSVFDHQVLEYFKKRPCLIENFIVNHVYLYGAMLFREDQIWRSYLEICLLVALLQFHLVGLAMKKKGLSDEQVLSLVQSFSRTFMQDRAYFNEAILYLIGQRLDTPETVVGLVLPS